MSERLIDLADEIIEGDKDHALCSADAVRIARHLLAAGYTKPRTITTYDELNALAVGSVVLGVSNIHESIGFEPHPYAKGWGGDGEWWSMRDWDGFGPADFFWDGSPEITVLHEHTI